MANKCGYGNVRLHIAHVGSAHTSTVALITARLFVAWSYSSWRDRNEQMPGQDKDVPVIYLHYAMEPVVVLLGIHHLFAILASF